MNKCSYQQIKAVSFVQKPLMTQALEFKQHFKKEMERNLKLNSPELIDLLMMSFFFIGLIQLLDKFNTVAEQLYVIA